MALAIDTSRGVWIKTYWTGHQSDPWTPNSLDSRRFSRRAAWRQAQREVMGTVEAAPKRADLAAAADRDRLPTVDAAHAQSLGNPPGVAA